MSTEVAQAAPKAAPVTNGAALVKALKVSGTGERKLAVARQKLTDVWHADRRTASAAEVVAALEASEDVGETTINKARMLAGLPLRRVAAAAESVPIEDRLLSTEVRELDADLPAELAEALGGETGEEGAVQEVPDFVGPAKPAKKPGAKK